MIGMTNCRRCKQRRDSFVNGEVCIDCFNGGRLKMNKKEAFREFEKIVDITLQIIKTDSYMGDPSKKRVLVLQCYDYIKENLK